MISEPPDWQSHKQAPIRGNWLRRFIKSRFRFVDYPFLLAYRGYGSGEKLLVQGHVFKGMALEKPSARGTTWRNFIALIKMFLVRTITGVQVQLRFNGQKSVAETTDNGYFEFEVKDHHLPEGWHKLYLQLLDELVEGQEKVELEVEVYIVKKPEYVVVSDIDDTLLVSHITQSWRKMYLLLTKDSQTRKPFQGASDFYAKLSQGTNGAAHPFFYVSSSEWNLYDFLIRFMKFHHFPKGVLQLKDLKDHWTDFFRSGYGGHNHKFQKIERILRTYPAAKLILLGDNGQQDALIYHQIAQNFPQRVKAIYIRNVKNSNTVQTHRLLKEVAKDVPTLQFDHSAEAEEHARQMGFIS